MFSTRPMRVFYVDEAGCPGMLPSATAPIQPVFALGGVILEMRRLTDFTLDWLHLKDQFFPNLRNVNSDFLDWIAVEIKGADLRKHLRESHDNRRRHAIGFMDKFLDLTGRDAGLWPQRQPCGNSGRGHDLLGFSFSDGCVCVLSWLRKQHPCSRGILSRSRPLWRPAQAAPVPLSRLRRLVARRHHRERRYRPQEGPRVVRAVSGVVVATLPHTAPVPVSFHKHSPTGSA